jgi:hypothetical protein
MAGAGGGPMAPGGLTMPKSPIGGPGGPGSTPMTSPGAGAGMQAAAMMGVRAAHHALMGYLTSFPDGSPEQQALFRAVTALNRIVKDAPPETSAAARRQNDQQGASLGGPLAGAPPPGVASAPLPGPGAMPMPGGLGEM